jgi:aspartate ammonia-lyase
VNPRLLAAYAQVKKACALANKELGDLDAEKADAILSACDTVEFPALSVLQGGAGTSTNMMVNEVIGNAAGAHPIEEVNLHQSTNDTYPTALKVAAIVGLRELSETFASLQGVFQKKEKHSSGVPILGKTELVDAVPLTLGAQFASFAEAFARDRWRTFKCEERLRTVNLGGTAIGTGLTAPRSYIFLVIEKLREVTGLGLSRAENMVESTANADCFVEVSGILNAAAVNLIKVSDDLRRLAMLGEIKLPAVQAGSSIMPGKVNPVILEAVMQIGIKVKANNQIVADCAARGSLQICEFMPLLADALLESIDLLISGAQMLAKHAAGIDADQGRCLERLYASPEIITAFVSLLGYDRCSELLKEFEQHGQGTIRQFLENELGKETVEKTLSPQNLMSLGHKG